MKVVTIGRSGDNNVVITDPHASRHHSQIIQHDNGTFRIVDLGSSNGTYVNGVRIDGGVFLRETDVVKIGNTTIPWQSYFLRSGTGTMSMSPNSGGDVPYSESHEIAIKKSSKGLWYGIIGCLAAVVAVVLLFLFVLPKDNIEPGTTYSYTQKTTYGEKNIDVKSFFVFTSPTDVIWLMGTLRNNMFPVGYGKYDSSKGEIVFSAHDKLHKYIDIYNSIKESSIIFQFDLKKNVAKLMNDIPYGEELSELYNNGNVFPLTKENYVLTPSHELAGTIWESYNAEYDGEYERLAYYNDDTDRVKLCFSSEKEVIIDGVPHAYIYMNDMVSITGGNNLGCNNVVGTYRRGNIITFFEEGYAHADQHEQIPFRRID